LASAHCQHSLLINITNLVPRARCRDSWCQMFRSDIDYIYAWWFLPVRW